MTEGSESTMARRSWWRGWWPLRWPWRSPPARRGVAVVMAIVMVAALLGAALVWAFWPAPLEVETAVAQNRPFEAWVEDDGRTRVRERMVVTMPWAGELERPAWKEGDAVAPGQPLFWVRSTQPGLMDERMQAEWRARGATAQASWQRAARQTEVALVAWQRAALAAARAVDLAEQAFISRAQLESSVLDLQREERSWRAAQEAERAALHEVELTRVMVSRISRPAGAARHAVVAPGSASEAATYRVLRVMQPHEAVLPAGAAVLELADVRNPEVVVSLLTQEALRLSVGSVARLSPWGAAASSNTPSAAPVTGRVRLIEPAASTKVSALGLEEQRVAVVIEPQVPLPPGDGYAVRVQLVLQSAENALQVPLSAVFPMPSDPTRHAVFIHEGGRARLTEVQLRGRGAGWAWIGAGLQAGQPVLVFPPAAVRDGARVRSIERRAVTGPGPATGLGPGVRP